jgi:zinc/manganese transport system permease protein
MAEPWFALPLLVLFGALLALGPLGARVLERGVVFIDLAVAQAAAAATLCFQFWFHTHDRMLISAVSAIGAILCAATVAQVSNRWPRRREALIGLMYVACAMVALVAAQASPHGREDLQALLAADVLWTNAEDSLVAIACGSLIFGVHRFRSQWLEHTPVFYLAFALTASLLVQILGVFLVFALLIAPALLAERFGWRRALGLSTLAIALGLVLSWQIDMSSGVCVSMTLVMVGFLGMCSPSNPPESKPG